MGWGERVSAVAAQREHAERAGRRSHRDRTARRVVFHRAVAVGVECEAGHRHRLPVQGIEDVVAQHVARGIRCRGVLVHGLGVVNQRQAVIGAGDGDGHRLGVGVIGGTAGIGGLYRVSQNQGLARGQEVKDLRSRVEVPVDAVRIGLKRRARFATIHRQHGEQGGVGRQGARIGAANRDRRGRDTHRVQGVDIGNAEGASRRQGCVRFSQRGASTVAGIHRDVRRIVGAGYRDSQRRGAAVTIIVLDGIGKGVGHRLTLGQ